jgi:hypothetical protein
MENEHVRKCLILRADFHWSSLLRCIIASLLDVGTATPEVATQTEEGIAYVNKTDVPARQNCQNIIHTDWKMQVLPTASCDILRIQHIFKILEVYFLCIQVSPWLFKGTQGFSGGMVKKH